MSVFLEVVDAGSGNTLQDAGRFGYRHLGIATGGFLDPIWAACANALLGNALATACIEMRALGPKFKVVGGVLHIAITGAVNARVIRSGGAEQSLKSWHSVTLQSGDQLVCGPVQGGVAYLAVQGGFDLPEILGSLASNSRLGGNSIQRGLPESGLMIACHDAEGAKLQRADPFEHSSGSIRVVIGPQDDHFSKEAIDSFLGAKYSVTNDFSRMGMRLAGDPLKHLTPAHADIVSDGIAPGAIQVPGNGLPIVLLADCQTVGGYPKVATVISADLPRLAQRKAGDVLQFEAVQIQQAHEIDRSQADRLRRWLGMISPYQAAGYIDLTALYANNLVDGMVRADPLHPFE